MSQAVFAILFGMGLTDQSIFGEALERGQFGLGVIDARLVVASRLGPLSQWLPPAGAPACDAPLLTHMEANFAELRESGEPMVLPSVRVGDEGPRVTVSVSWSENARVYVVVTAPDHAGEQIDRLMASDRREKQILRQQADAAAARLRAADALYRDIVESSDDLVLRFGPDFRLVFANRAAASFLGRAQDALVGAAMSDLFPADGAPWRLARAAEGRAVFEQTARDAKGRVVWLAWEVSFLGPEAGGEFQAVSRDVTAERRLRVAQEKAQEEARAAAIANERLRIAHDLHDTLARSIVTMIAQARLIAKKTGDPEAKAALAELDVEARQGLREAREAIAQTRAARRENVDLRGVAKEFEARRTDIVLTLDFDAETPLAPETETLFAAVLREALRNIELHAGAKRVSISMKSSEAGAEMTIEDDGAGFDPQTPTPGHFGVAGMRERAALAGATLEMESAPGKGTRIRVETCVGAGR
ncbi:sensor histidine kinase [Methylocystis parvus]|uniref:sensor histidine kinase n=1 Tax=Methylocystis parvus TaxID=134 RepID=UPI0002E78CF5|nr:sensor histidine kinase [Methylocystis parvus]WBJ99194.1 sensor histidine kinase [Methylocystis parvus OBBP]